MKTSVAGTLVARGGRRAGRAPNLPNYVRHRPVGSIERLAYPLLACATLVGIWLLAHQHVPFVPSPLAVAKEVPDFVANQPILSSLGASLTRVVVGMLLALSAGLLSAYLMALGTAWRSGIEVYVTVCFGIPGLAAALFSLMVFGLAETGVYVAVAVVTYPFAAIAFRDGFTSIDPRIGEMARVYRLGRIARLWHVSIPTITPYILSAIRNIHALAWKLTIIAEVFMARDGIGGKFKVAFDNFQLDDVIMWLSVFLLVLFGVEYLLLRPLEHYVYRWKR